MLTGSALWRLNDPFNSRDAITNNFEEGHAPMIIRRPVSGRVAILGAAGLLSLGLLQGPGQADGHLHLVATDAFPPQAGWAMETDDAYILARAGCVESLTRRTADGALEPALAESWTRHSPTEWDFTIRQGVTFSDGTPFDATVAAEALNRMLSATAPPRAFAPKRIASVSAVDDMTVRIESVNPSVLTPMRVSSPNTGFLAPAAFAGDAVDPVGHCIGPFDIVEHVPQQALMLKRHDAYWGGPAQLESGEMRFIPEGSGRATQLRTGEAHVSARLPVTEVLGLQSEADVVVQTVAQARTNSLYLNNQKAPLDNMAVRQAIQSAIDSAAIAQAIYEGSAQAAVGPFGPNDPWAPEDAMAVSQDVERARALIAESGVDAESLNLVLYAYVERAELPDLAAVIQAQLGAIGINVELKVANYGALEPDLLSGEFDMLVLSRGYLSDVADPIGFLTADYTCEGGYNLSRFCDPDIDAMVDQASSAESEAERYALYKDIARELQSRAVTVFLVHQQGSDGHRSNVANYAVHPDGHYLFTKDLALN